MARYDDEDLAGDGGDGRPLKKSDNKKSPGKATTEGARLLAYLERIIRLEEEKATIGEDVREVYGEAKAEGYDTKIMRKMIKDHKKDKQEKLEEELLLETYMAAVGWL